MIVGLAFRFVDFMLRLLRLPAFLFVALLASGPTWANPVSTEHVTARLLAERATVAPGAAADLLLMLEIEPLWHTYWRNPGDSGEAPRIDWTLPPGVGAGPLGFPRPALIRVGPLANYGYSGRALHPVSLKVPADWPVGEPIPVRAEAHWLVCEEHCVPESAVLLLTLPTAAEPGALDTAAVEPFAAARTGLPTGIIGGAMLNRAAGSAGLGLAVPWGPERPSPSEAWFFPYAWGLIEHAAKQPWRLAAGGLEIDLTPGATAAQVAPDGLLVVQADGQSQSFELQVQRGTLDTGTGPTGTGPASTTLGLPLALGFAFLGGLILNLMPCVFPVLAIKALGLAGQGGLGTGARVLHGLAYTGGVLVFFGAIAGLLLGLRAGGAALGWGFQLQYPPFVAAMAYLFVIMGLSLAGALTLGGRLMGLAGGQGRGGLAGAFGTGALAALVAAPCTAPFMGAALGYAVTLPWPLALAILLTLGLGLAAPFLLLSLVPALARRLPRPGPWMEGLKQFLAFPLFATAAWLVWVLSVQVGPQGVALVLTGLLLLTFGLWLRERTALGTDRVARVGSLAALAGLVGALWLAILTDGPGVSGGSAAETQTGGRQARPGLVSEPFSAERLAAAQAQGRPVFVNMTAAWCITCLVNERVALSTDAVAAAFNQSNTLYLKGDWTNRDAAITAYLEGFGRNGVPLYVVYRPGQAPLVLPQVLTPATVREAVTAP